MCAEQCSAGSATKVSNAIFVGRLRVLILPMQVQENGLGQHTLAEGPSFATGAVKVEEPEHASVSGDESGQNGRGRKRRRKGKDRKAVQPVRSYPTRERAKAEAEVVAEVSLPCGHVKRPPTPIKPYKAASNIHANHLHPHEACNVPRNLPMCSCWCDVCMHKPHPQVTKVHDQERILPK